MLLVLYTSPNKPHRCLDPSQVSHLNYRWIKRLTVSFSSPGESPPPPPRVLFGRDEVVEKIVGFAESLMPFALVGLGGIGKTSIALTVLHDERIKRRFGDDRRLIRCDQFPASVTHFLSRLSNVIGAGIGNPKDLAALQPFLSSKEMLIVLDNAESILDPGGKGAQDILTVVEELSQFGNVCLGTTSRTTPISSKCETLNIPALSTEAARNIFHSIYKSGERLDIVDDILEQVDSHPLSLTLLATVAHHNKWDIGRLAKEWEKQRTSVPQTEHSESLAAAIELSLASPMLRDLEPDARDLLGVVAFFPQGVDEDNLGWLFPAIPDRTNIFDKFCTLSLTNRINGFVTMLAPLRDHLYPKDPKSCSPLCAAKECYFRRLSVDPDPDKPGFERTRWITSEDVNVEHLLDIFTSIDPNSASVWDICAHFMDHLYRHKPRLVVLGPGIEGLPDDHPSKPRCLLAFSRLLGSVTKFPHCKQLLIHALRLWRERGDDLQVARTLALLASVNWALGLHKEGIPQVKEASEIYERLNRTLEQANSLRSLALLFTGDNQFDAAEEVTYRATNLSSDEGRQSQAWVHHNTLGLICQSRGETKAAIDHLEAALGIASSLNSQEKQVSILLSLTSLLLEEGRLDDAQAHLERLRSHGATDPYSSCATALLQARIWRQQGRVEEARSEVSRIIDVYEKTRVLPNLLEYCRRFLRELEEVGKPVTSG